ncbi:uncharacterized protein LOC144657137 isoform X2 [Oculina patagonica]
MSLVQKSSQPDKQRNANGVYLVLDAFIRENMLRRLFSFRRPKQEEKENAADNIQKENVDPNSQTVVQTNQLQSSILKAEPDLTVKMESREDADTLSNHDLVENRTREKNMDQQQLVPESCLTLEPSPLSDAESETKDCDSVKDEVSISGESERCESSTSAEDKDESGIEQDFEPTTVDQNLNSNANQSTTELKKEPFKPDKAPESPSLPLIPINLKSHLKRNDRIKTLNRIPKRVPNKMEQGGSSCDSSPEKCPSFLPTKTINIRKQLPPHRVQYSRGFSVTPPRQSRRNKVPEMFGDIIIKDRFRARSQIQSPVRKGILKHPNASRSAAMGVKYATTPKKSRAISSKGKKTSAVSSDSGLSDGEGSSGEEQKRMPVKKIFSNQQALRKRIDDLNGMLKTMEQQRSELQAVLHIIEDWSEDLRTVDRTNLGVPYIRAVKQLLGKQRIALTSRKSDFNRRILNLKEAQVPFSEEFSNLIQQLRKEVSYVVRDQRKYSARSVESVRQLQGRLIGTCSAILSVYYEE